MSCPEWPFEGSVPTGELPRWLFEASVPQAFASAALAPKVKVLGGWALGVGVINPEDGASGMGLASPQVTFTFHFHFPLSCIGEGNGNPLQYSCLENPRDRGAWWAAIYGVAQSRTRLKRLSSSSSSSRGDPDSCLGLSATRGHKQGWRSVNWEGASPYATSADTLTLDFCLKNREI